MINTPSLLHYHAAGALHLHRMGTGPWIVLILLSPMDAATVASELQAHKLREGPIYKRTKFLQEW